MKTKFNFILILILSITFISCYQNEKNQKFDYGHIENNKYINSFFGLEITIPDNWIIQTKEQTDNLSKRGKDLVVGDNKNLKAAFDASEINTANLLAVFQYEVGTPVEYNPGLVLVAENLKNAPGIKNGSDYLFQSKKLLKQSQLQYDYIDDKFEKEIINNQEFYTMNCSISYMGININQKYYSTIINGFSLGAIISFVNDEQKASLEKTINTINFSK